jgi:hypothetical protein
LLSWTISGGTVSQFDTVCLDSVAAWFLDANNPLFDSREHFVAAFRIQLTERRSREKKKKKGAHDSDLDPSSHWFNGIIHNNPYTGIVKKDAVNPRTMNGKIKRSRTHQK